MNIFALMIVEQLFIPITMINNAYLTVGVNIYMNQHINATLLVLLLYTQSTMNIYVLMIVVQLFILIMIITNVYLIVVIITYTNQHINATLLVLHLYIQ